MSDLLTVTNLHISFDQNHVLSGVDLELGRGEAVALIGANGAGKTTLLKAITRLLRPTAGTVKLNGDDLENLSRRQIARCLAVVPQSSPQVFGYDVLEFVLMGYYAGHSGFLPTEEQIDGAKQALEQLGILDLSHRPVAQISGGELQRALMARAMVAELPLWLLDEPTASLDMCHQIALLEQVRAHVDRGGSALAILHDLALVHRFFDRVAVLLDGQIDAAGSPDQVLTPSRISNVFGVPMQRGEIDGKIVWVAR